MAKSVTLADFLTDEQIGAAKAIYIEHRGTSNISKLIAEQVIEPNIAAINAKLGQQNDAKYLAYACEHVFSRARV